jgi:HlyD family secretion protein
LVYPAELLKSDSSLTRGIMADQKHLFDMRKQEEVQLRAQLQARIEQYNQNIVALIAQIRSLKSQRMLIEPELRNVRELWDKQLVTIGRVNQLERSAIDLEGNVAAQQAQIAQVRARIAETREQLIQLSETRRVESGQELARVNTALNEQRQRKVSASDQESRTDIRAPYSGVVEKVAFTAIGEVIRPAEPIMEIVPDNDQMVVETMVALDDIDQVTTGQVASIRFSSFNRAATPEIPGKVVYVATDRSELPDTHRSYYSVRVAIDKAEMQRLGLMLRSGMPADVYIRTGSRTMFSYLTKPLRDQMARSFRDN